MMHSALPLKNEIFLEGMKEEGQINVIENFGEEALKAV